MTHHAKTSVSVIAALALLGIGTFAGSAGGGNVQITQASASQYSLLTRDVQLQATAVYTLASGEVLSDIRIEVYNSDGAQVATAYCGPLGTPCNNLAGNFVLMLTAPDHVTQWGQRSPGAIYKFHVSARTVVGESHEADQPAPLILAGS